MVPDAANAVSTARMTDDLDARRIAAAERTGGVSSGSVYDAAWRQIAPRAKGDVLDVGAGTGSLSARLANETAVTSVTAADLAAHATVSPPGAAAKKVRWLSADLNTPLPLPAASFDLIVAIEIVEHLENPRATAREWRRLLRPGGALVMSTPNTESIRSLLSFMARGQHASFTARSYPEHITPLARVDLQRVLAEAGFTGIEFSWSNFGLVPALSLSWQGLSASLLGGMRFSDNLVVVAQ
jgi:2-polyprenyl-3-methyl-5-hydroxy-6-metoxy-1,4-benzoquinol methylase